MTARAALGAALVDLYRQSWRFFLLNAALSAFIVPVAIAGLWVPAVWLLLVGAGPLAAALMHCAVVTAVTEELRLADALDFYAGQGALVLAAVATYLLLALGIFQLLLWPLAVYETDVPVRNVASHALDALLRRPGQVLVLGLTLIVVNAAGLVAAVMPFLTLTIAYTFLAAARFVLPPSPVEEVPDTWPA